MSIDALHVKMKRQENTLMVDFSLDPELLPPAILEAYDDICDAYKQFCDQLLTGLKGKAAAVRFSVIHFVLLGERGIPILSELLAKASSMGFYVLLDVFGISSALAAKRAAERIWGEESPLPCDGILISGYWGTELLKPFLPYCQEKKKDIFVAVRSPNKSSSEIQDLLVGSRTVHMAAADYVNRFSTSAVGRFGYSCVCIAASATMGGSIKMLRSQYPQMFLLIDGLDASGANAKNASYGFNNLGHGAICCVGSSVTCAWNQPEYAGMSFAEAAAEAAEKAQRKINRYVTIH